VVRYGQFETAEALLDHYSKLTGALLQSTASPVTATRS